MRASRICAAFCLMQLLAPVAAAQTKRVAATSADSASRAYTSGDKPVDWRVLGHAYTHDGVYFRLGLGFGGFSDSMASNAKNASDEHATGRVNAVASMGEIMLGGSVSARTAVGGGVWTSTVLASNFHHTGGDAITSRLENPDTFTLIGPFVDWYFSARPGADQPGAFHLQGAAALAVLNGLRLDEARYDDHRNIGWGAGLMAGIGYEWWVHEQWGLGALARLTVAGLGERDQNDALYYHGIATFPSFLMTATLN